MFEYLFYSGLLYLALSLSKCPSILTYISSESLVKGVDQGKLGRKSALMLYSLESGHKRLSVFKLFVDPLRIIEFLSFKRKLSFNI